MRVPVSWLRDFVEIRLDIEELAEKLTFAGLEVEAIEYIGLPSPRARGVGGDNLVWDRQKIFVGQLVEVKPHPNADRLLLAVVDYGRGETVQVVTGAPNIKVGDKGQKVVLALEGAQLYDGHKEGRVRMTLKRSKIRGVESGSMVCSEKELGLSEEHEGIILLPDDAPVGMPLADYMGDIVLDIKINPNFARAQSVLGVAREIAALTNQLVRLPAGWNTAETGLPETNFVKIEIADASLCMRFSALLVRGVTIAPSPYWMRRRLELCGMRPINNVVDITNYVMLGYGKPLHAFDYDRLVARAGGRPTIIVRAAKPGEGMVTLDGVKREFKEHDILVTDTAGPVGIGGIMGGADTEVSEATRNVLLESAIFNFTSIRRTTLEQKLPSEAATRFGRGIPPSQNVAPARLACELMRDLAGGEIDPNLADNYPAPQIAPKIDLTPNEVRRILGVDLSIHEITHILKNLDFEVEHLDHAVRVTPPDYRLDVDGADDVIEELVRIYGYDRIPSTLIADALPPLEGNEELEQEEGVRDVLLSDGLEEVVTYAFTHPSREAALSALPEKESIPIFPLPARPYVVIANPISEERSVLRQTLLPNVLDVTAANLRHTIRVAFYEIGKVFLTRTQDEDEDRDALPEDRGLSLPAERRRLAIVLSGPRELPSWQSADVALMDFFDLKAVVENLVSGLHVRAVTYAGTKHPMLHPGRAAVLKIGGEEVGVFGELHPIVRERWELPAQPVMVGEFDLEALLGAMERRFIVRPISRYPAVVQDIALELDEGVPGGLVESLIRQTGGAVVTDVRLFDVYRGSPLPPGKKSLAFRITFQALDHGLTDEEAGKIRDKIVLRLGREVGAELRGG